MRDSCKKKFSVVMSNHMPASKLTCIFLLQVVGIFAGFGVLLLVASPFLLLAAPCILCCKCKICRCCDEEEGEGFST